MLSVKEVAARLGVCTATVYALVERGELAHIRAIVLDHDGNLIDTAALAAMAALSACRMPKVEDKKIIRGEFVGSLPLKDKVVTCTYGKHAGKTFLDPTFDEERGMDCRLTLATTPECLCAAQKGGWGSVTEREILELTDLSIKKGNDLRSLL